MGVQDNPLLIPYESVEVAKRVADSLGISYQIVRYAGQSVVWIISLEGN